MSRSGALETGRSSQYAWIDPLSFFAASLGAVGELTLHDYAHGPIMRSMLKTPLIASRSPVAE
jgi:hypothetical protein